MSYPIHRNRLTGIFLALASLALAAAPSALADGRNAGSALIYPVHRSGGQFFTVICVTNTNLSPVGGSTLAHYEYVNVTANSANPFLPLSCTVFNRTELLTPADTLCVLTRCHNAVNPGGQEGYLVVSAQDPDHFDRPWAFDWLIGSELVISSSGIMYSVNAIPFEARVPAGAPTDVDGDGNLDFDDVEYEGIPDLLYMDSFIAVQASQLALINLTGRHQDVATVQFSIWNDNEFPLSTDLQFSCWFNQPLQEISQIFTQNFLRHSTPHDPGELLIDCGDPHNVIETGWAFIDSTEVRTTGGLPVSSDGALLGALVSGDPTRFDGAHLLWESKEKQFNGSAFEP